MVADLGFDVTASAPGCPLFTLANGTLMARASSSDRGLTSPQALRASGRWTLSGEGPATTPSITRRSITPNPVRRCAPKDIRAPGSSWPQQFEGRPAARTLVSYFE